MVGVRGRRIGPTHSSISFFCPPPPPPPPPLPAVVAGEEEKREEEGEEEEEEGEEESLLFSQVMAMVALSFITWRRWVGGWVGGWVGLGWVGLGWVEEEEAVWMRCCGLLVGGVEGR